MSEAYRNEVFRARTTANASLAVALLKLPQRAFLLWLYLPGYLKT
jgi:regulator of sirC expression with transglutaminase-like and TPR domain